MIMTDLINSRDGVPVELEMLCVPTCQLATGLAVVFDYDSQSLRMKKKFINL
jgi:hypothetical protein